MKTNEYLALLYVQSRDLTDAAPGDLLEIYQGALAEINAREGEQFGSRRPLTRPAQDGVYIS